MESNRDVAMLKDGLRQYPRDLPVAVEVWDESAGGSPGCDEPAAQAFYDPDAGYFVIELLRRFPKGGPFVPLGMGTRGDLDREGWASDVRVPAGTMTVGTLLDSLSGTGSAEAVAVRVWVGGDPEDTDVGLFTVMEFPLQYGISTGDEDDPDERGKTFDALGIEMPVGEDEIAYVVLGLMEGQFSLDA